MGSGLLDYYRRRYKVYDTFTEVYGRVLISLERDAKPYIIGRPKVYDRGSMFSGRIWVTSDLTEPIEGGQVVKGRILALMKMIDSGDVDSKVVITRLDADGQPMHPLTEDDKRRMTQFFDTYKKHEGKVTKVTGWADRHGARFFLEHTHGFFTSVR